jgi:hypothetical protein
MIGYFFGYADFDKTYSMKTIIEILLSLACVYAIFMQLLRIIWLYFPSFMHRSSLYRIKAPGKTEMLLYFILAIVVMAYFIFIKMQKILQPEFFTAHL